MPSLLDQLPRLPMLAHQRPYWDFAQALRRLREGLGESQGTMADRLRRSQSYISQVHTGRVKPSLDFLQSLRDEYGIDLDEWMRLARLIKPGSEDQEDERATIARLAAETVVKRLLETVWMESLADEFLRRLRALQEQYGVASRVFLNEGPDELTRERMEEYLTDIAQMMAREVAEIAQKDEGLPPPDTGTSGTTD